MRSSIDLSKLPESKLCEDTYNSYLNLRDSFWMARLSETVLSITEDKLGKYNV